MKYIIAICTCLLVFGCVGQQQEAKVASKPINEDVQSGTSLYLDDSAQILTAESIDGKILWSVDVIKECGIPAVGDPKVRNVTIQDEKANVVFGKHSFATVDLNSGEIDCQGAD